MWAPVTVIGVIVAAAVALAFAGWSAGDIVSFLAGVAGVAGTTLTALVLVVNRRQNAKLERIETAVNGELDRRIEAGVKRALTAAGLHPPTQPPRNRHRPF